MDRAIEDEEFDDARRDAHIRYHVGCSCVPEVEPPPKPRLVTAEDIIGDSWHDLALRVLHTPSRPR